MKNSNTKTEESAIEKFKEKLEELKAEEDKKYIEIKKKK